MAAAVARLRAAASVVLISPKAKEAGSLSNYAVLMLKRASTHKFMPNTHVFPGGSIDVTDEDTTWLSMVNNDEVSQTELSYRIAAVRETIEEAGVLLTTSMNVVPSIELAEYRRQLNMNADDRESGYTLLELCKRYNLQPLINSPSMSLWSHWVTPRTYSKRFDTRFYLTVLPDEASAYHACCDGSETVQADWLRPEEALHMHANNQLILYPPQFYILNEMLAYRTIDELYRLAEKRNRDGVTRIEPKIMEINGQLVSVLPGDVMHYDNEGQETSTKRHRIFFTSDSTDDNSRYPLRLERSSDITNDNY